MPRRLRPALFDVLADYSWSQLRRDVMAGLVVGVVAIPLAMAFAIASNAGADAPRVGLITAVVAGTAAALLGGSRVLVTGPTGAFVVVLASVVARHGLDGLLLATLMAGVLLVLAGWFRLGRLITFIPYPVTVGFTAGIAVVIFLGQTPDLLGVTLTHAPAEPLAKAAAVAAEVVRGAWTPAALALAALTVIIIEAMRRFVPRVPGPVVALVALTVAAQYAHWPVALVGDRFAIPTGLPGPHIPDITLTKIRLVFPDAVTIALLGAIESLLAAVVADGMLGTRHRSDQELVAQGVANIASPLFGGIAATGAIARTATNVQNGGRTPVAALVHVGVVLAAIFLAAPLATRIPIAVLAGILATVAWNMSEKRQFARLLRMPRPDAAVLVVTFVLTILVDLAVAVGVGLVMAAGIFLHRVAGLTRTDSIDPFADPELAPVGFTPSDIPDDVLVYSMQGPFFFGAADQFQDVLSRVAKTPRVIILRMRDVPYMDATGAQTLGATITSLHKRGARVMLASLQAQPREVLARSGLLTTLGPGNVSPDTMSALRLTEARNQTID